MRKLLLASIVVLVVVLLPGCNGDNSTSNSPFVGTWKMTFAGTDSGSGQVVISDGTLSGNWTDPYGDVNMLGGSVSQSGVLTGTIHTGSGSEIGYINGNFSAGSGSGKWATQWGGGGTWSATR